MSLIITSNIGQENNPAASNAFKPYSYQNRLLNTMKIPANSEIALQSAKINKNGLFILDRTNSGFCHYFGTPVEDLFFDNIDNSTTQPFRAVIGAGEAFRAGDVKNEVNIDDMVGEIQKGLNEATFHPSLITSDNSTNIVVSAKYDSSDQVFEGFKFVATQQTAKTNLSSAGVTWTSLNANGDDTTHAFTQANGKVTSTTEQGFYVQNRQYPISQNAGTCVFNFSEANTNSNWMCGLSRINVRRDNPDGSYDYMPSYFVEPALGSTLRQGVEVGGQNRFFDVAIARVGNELRVFQSSSRTQLGADGIYCNAVTYFGLHNANFNSVYNINTNTDNYVKVRFTLSNEEIKIELGDDEGGYTLLCDYTTLRAAGAVKNECLNPTNACKWAMYPVCSVGGTVVAGRGITLAGIDYYSNYPVFDATKYYKYDYWGSLQRYNQTVFGLGIELRDWNNFSRTVSSHGAGAIGLLPPKGVNASGGMTDYDSLIITARSNAYGEGITSLCNTQSTLGFVGDPISRPLTPALNLVTTNQSSTTPKLISNISLFIRLNNFTQNTINARQGTTSKIIAHLPRFDNSGNETGGLYFEPQEKTYIALNNPQELLINSFDIDIVYENETFCKALTGKTVVCLHIRPARMFV
jgi:hypothetical protein